MSGDSGSGIAWVVGGVALAGLTLGGVYVIQANGAATRREEELKQQLLLQQLQYANQAGQSPSGSQYPTPNTGSRGAIDALIGVGVQALSDFLADLDIF